MKYALFLVSIMSLLCGSVYADAILQVYSLNESKSKNISHAPFVFAKAIAYERELYMSGDRQSGILSEFDREKSEPKNVVGLAAPLMKYRFEKDRLIVSNSNVHLLASNEQVFTLKPSNKPGCYIVQESEGRKDKMLMCIKPVSKAMQ